VEESITELKSVRMPAYLYLPSHERDTQQSLTREKKERNLQKQS
jgi:hypothetical protein